MFNILPPTESSDLSLSVNSCRSTVLNSSGYRLLSLSLSISVDHIEAILEKKRDQAAR